MKLRQQEKTVSFVAIAIVLIFLLIFKVILPSRQKFRQLDKKITQKEQEVKEMRSLQARYKELLKIEKDVQASMEKRDKNFFGPALWARLAEKAKVPEENFKQEIKQSSAAKEGSIYKDVSVHLELDNVTLEQLTKFIYEIEAVDPFLKIKNMHLRRVERFPGILKVSFDVLTQIK